VIPPLPDIVNTPEGRDYDQHDRGINPVHDPDSHGCRRRPVRIEGEEIHVFYLYLVYELNLTVTSDLRAAEIRMTRRVCIVTIATAE
jgi:hypothetical protein